MTQSPDRHIRLLDYGALLGSRWLGMQVRTRIEKALDAGETTRIVVDAEGIDSMSHSFADECFGKLVERRGLAVLQKAIELRAIPPAASKALRHVIGERSRKQE
jgi:hypothetical protein